MSMAPVSLVPIILSGGAGTRLWPLSREAAPKPFMPLPDGDTLLAKTARRALPARAGEPAAFAVRRFVEKPALARAREYLTAGHFLWNSGMFAFTATAILAALERHAPALLAACRPVADALAADSASDMREIDAALFAAVPDISIDYAVMEPAAAA